MEEMVEVWSADGAPSGEIRLKSEVHLQGLYHATIHLWLYTGNGKVLFQKRADSKKNFPGLWDVSVAGHVSAGESIREAMVRECREELGLTINADEPKLLGIFKEEHDHGPDYRDREFHHCFLLKLESAPEQLKLQHSEVAAARWVPLTKCAEEIWGLANPGAYVPHPVSYYKEVFRAIRKQV